MGATIRTLMVAIILAFTPLGDDLDTKRCDAQGNEGSLFYGTPARAGYRHEVRYTPPSRTVPASGVTPSYSDQTPLERPQLPSEQTTFKPQGAGGYQIPDAPIPNSLNSGSSGIGFASGAPNQPSAFSTGSTATGPSTAPNALRDNSWMTNNSSGLPTTDPTRSSASSPFAAPPSDNPFNTNTRQPLGATATFGSTPAGMSLPPKTPQSSTSPSTFGSEFSRTAASGDPRPVLGPPTAEQAGFDPSLYNRNSSMATRSTSSGSMAFPPSSPSATTSAQSSLGFPSSTTNAELATIPFSDWTNEQLFALAAMYGVPKNDPRIGDRQFMNDLHARYLASITPKPMSTSHQVANNGMYERNPSNQTSASQVGSPFDALAKTGVNTNTSPYSDPRYANNNNRTAPPTIPGSTNHSQSWPNDRLASRNGTVGGIGVQPSSQTPGSSQSRFDVDPRLSDEDKKRLPLGAYTFDKYGNPIDRYNNILNQWGEKVDDDTAYELTIGRLEKKRAQERDRKLAGLDDGRWGSGANGSATGRLNPPNSNHDPRLTLGHSGNGAAMIGLPGGPKTSLPNTNLAGQGSGASGNGSDGLRSDPHGSSKSKLMDRQSNPYVNFFLLCSIVSNVFLFVWLHRLWQNHRDLIASSRLSTSTLVSAD